MVVLKHMFTVKELDEDPGLALDLKEEVREEAESVGTVTNVTLYDVSTRGSDRSRNPITDRSHQNNHRKRKME